MEANWKYTAAYQMILLSSCRWRCIKVQLVGLHTLWWSKLNLIQFCVHCQPNSLTPRICPVHKETQSNMYKRHPEITYIIILVINILVYCIDGNDTMQHFRWVHKPHCASQHKQLSSVHQHSKTHVASHSLTVQVPVQSWGKILRRGRSVQISSTRSTEQGCSCCSSWCGMEMITPGRVLACQHEGFWYSVSLQSQWLSLLDRIQPQPCLRCRQRAAVCTPLWLRILHDKLTYV